MRQAICDPHAGGIRNYNRRVNTDSGILASLFLNPSEDILRSGEAIESRQFERAAIPIENRDATGLALPTEIDSQKPQNLLF
jgi:hypothetical protein